MVLGGQPPGSVGRCQVLLLTFHIVPTADPPSPCVPTLFLIRECFGCLLLLVTRYTLIAQLQEYCLVRHRSQAVVLNLSMMLTAMGFLVACGSGSGAPTPLPIVPTFAPVTADAAYWDLGVSVKYPDNWIAPLYDSGHMLLVPTKNDVARQPPVNPIVELQFATLAQLHFTKEATLAQIVAYVSGQTATTKPLNVHTSQFAGLDASLIDLEDAQNQLEEETIAFRMPDGRIGWLLGLGPSSTWGDFITTFDAIRASGMLLKPTAYNVLQPNTNATFAQGGLTFSIPATWKSQSLGSSVTLYNSDTAYNDSSGFANGPQLVVRALPLGKAQSLADALTQVIGTTTKPTDMTVGNQPAVQVITSDAHTGQQIIFIATASQDKSVLNVLRWTTPAPLSEVTRPLLDTILKSVTFGTVASSAGASAPAPNPTFFKSIPQAMVNPPSTSK